MRHWLGVVFFPGTICKLFISGYLNASGRLTSSVSSWGTNRGTVIIWQKKWDGVVSQRPIKGVLDAFCSCSPNSIACIQGDEQIC